MERDKFDFTDNQLKEIYRSLLLSLNERNSYWTTSRRRIFNKLLNELDDNVKNRKNKDKILSMFYDLDERNV